MKNLLALICLLAASCLAPRARQHGLVPAVIMAWEGVRADTMRGIDDAMEDGDITSRMSLDMVVFQIDEALEQGAPTALISIIDWSVLHPYAVRGIQDRVDDGEMIQAIADGPMTERLNNFTQAFSMLRTSYIPLEPSKYNEHWLPNGGGRVTDQAAIAVATTN